jgi:hypothetical protein
VRDVDPVQVAVGPLGRLAVAVELAPRDVPQQVEAVQLVEDVELGDVGVVAEAVLGRELDRQRRVFAYLSDVVGRDREGADPFEFLPGVVDLLGWVEAVAESGWVGREEETAVEALVFFFELFLQVTAPKRCYQLIVNAPVILMSSEALQ